MKKKTKILENNSDSPDGNSDGEIRVIESVEENAVKDVVIDKVTIEEDQERHRKTPQPIEESK